MISYLSGTIVDISSHTLTLEVQGVGYAVSVADERAYKLGQLLALYIYFHWTAEQGPQLFGFETQLAKTVFTGIVSCSGCGPKIGLAVLSQMAPEQFLQAIAIGDTKALSSVNGIGPKKAELMIMQLKDKVAKIVPTGATSDHSALAKIKQLHAALDALHYKPAEIASAFEKLKKDTLLEGPFDELLRKSLSYLAKRL